MITLEVAGKDQNGLVNEINRFNSSARPETLEKRQNKKYTLENLKALYTGSNITNSSCASKSRKYIRKFTK